MAFSTSGRIFKANKKGKKERDVSYSPLPLLLAAHGIGEDGDTQTADGCDPGEPRCCTGSAQHRKSRLQCLLLLLVLLLQLLMVTPLIQASREQNSGEGTHSSCTGQHKPKKTNCLILQIWNTKRLLCSTIRHNPLPQRTLSFPCH